MSKAKLIELVKASDFDLTYWLAETPVDVVRETLRLGLKEVALDVRHGCAEECAGIAGSAFSDDTGSDLAGECHDACINYQDKDLEGL